MLRLLRALNFFSPYPCSDNTFCISISFFVHVIILLIGLLFSVLLFDTGKYYLAEDGQDEFILLGVSFLMVFGKKTKSRRFQHFCISFDLQYPCQRTC